MIKEMKTDERRYDIDWLRAITIGLLLIYHISIAFQPWGVFIGFIQSDEHLKSLWIPMSILNVWRIPLLFFVSGMGVYFAMRKRTWKQLLIERTGRIFLPFLFGTVFIVPVHLFIWQKYYSQNISYSLNPGHLWFLGYIFIYVGLFIPVFFYLKKNESGFIARWLKNLFGHPVGLMLIVTVFILEALLVNPGTWEMYAMTIHGFIIGMLSFLFGFCCILAGNSFWQTILTWRWLFLAIAATLFSIRFFGFDLRAPNYLIAIESNAWMFAVLGFAYKYLNHQGKTLTYISQGAYPIYIIHMVFLYLGSLMIFQLHLIKEIKFFLVVAFTTIGSLAMYELLIRRIGILRILFGLKK